jgi:hypothetical protein
MAQPLQTFQPSRSRRIDATITTQRPLTADANVAWVDQRFTAQISGLREQTRKRLHEEASLVFGRTQQPGRIRLDVSRLTGVRRSRMFQVRGSKFEVRLRLRLG